MTPRQKLKKYSRINRQISPYANGPQGGEAGDGSKIGRSSSYEAKDSCDTESHIKGQPSAEDITSKPPEYCTDQQSDVLCEG